MLSLGGLHLADAAQLSPAPIRHIGRTDDAVRETMAPQQAEHRPTGLLWIGIRADDYFS